MGMGRRRKKEYEAAEASPIPLSIATATLSSDALIASRSLESEELVSPLSHSAPPPLFLYLPPAASPPGLSVCPPRLTLPSPLPCRTRPQPSLTSPYFIPSPPPSLRPSFSLSFPLPDLLPPPSSASAAKAEAATWYSRRRCRRGFFAPLLRPVHLRSAAALSVLVIGQGDPNPKKQIKFLYKWHYH